MMSTASNQCNQMLAPLAPLARCSVTCGRGGTRRAHGPPAGPDRDRFKHEGPLLSDCSTRGGVWKCECFDQIRTKEPSRPFQVRPYPNQGGSHSSIIWKSPTSPNSIGGQTSSDFKFQKRSPRLGEACTQCTLPARRVLMFVHAQVW